jgi:hypothetical protein
MTKWSELLTEKWRVWDVKHTADELQRTYNRWNIVGVLMTLVGAVIICITDDPRIIGIGVFLALTGMINVAIMKTWVHTKLSMLHVIWEMRREHGLDENKSQETGDRRQESDQ